jgi:DNA polymerase-4
MDSSSRKIIHIDADCFYAAIEMRDDPSLRGRPMAVGGASDRRGVITTCNYEARAFGVHSAMASATALRLCPDLILVKHRFDAYREASAGMREIFHDYSDLIEPLSLDEAFLDVTASENCRGSATLMAREIRQRVHRDIGITVSAGIAPSKFLAKVASDWNKPDGVFVVLPEQVDDFVFQLSVDKIFGVGRVTAGRLEALGVSTCGQLRAFTVFALAEHFGSFGKRLYELCRGVDTRAVKPSRRRKSLSVETTFPVNLNSLDTCQQQLPALLEELRKRLSRVDSDYTVAGVSVKIKFEDFTVTTVERSATAPELTALMELCEIGFQRGARPVRLLGAGVRFRDLQGACSPEQLDLFTKV